MLREVADADVPIFFEHQSDPEAVAMANVPAREYDAHMAHWAGTVLADESVVVRTIEIGGEVAGNVVSWRADGRRMVGYWLGREFWGRGIASAALAEFLEQLPERPLRALVAPHNAGSLRVLEKCGFVRMAGDGEPLVLELTQARPATARTDRCRR